MDSAGPSGAGGVDERTQAGGLSSLELLGRARGGDTAALDDLCARYLPRLRRWAAGRLPRWARGSLDTDDLVQETLLRTVRRVKDFQPKHDGALQAYLRQVLHNRILEAIRKAKRKPDPVSLDSQKADPGPSPLEETVGHQDLERYDEALKKLPQTDRELIVLRLELGCDYAEMAEALHKPSPNAVRMAVARAVTRLAEEIARAR